MHFSKSVWVSGALLVASALTSCNLGKAPEPTPDVNGIYTSAAQTMIAGLSAQQTQTAAAAPVNTPTPLASFTPLATFAISTGSIPFGTPFTLGTPFAVGTAGTPIASLPAGANPYSFPVGCSDATNVGETAPYDGTVLAGGKLFTKGWSFVNTGTCAWDEGFSFSFKSGDRMQGEDVLITKTDNFTKPGQGQAFVIHMQAPRAAKEYKGFWQMKNDTGQWFGSIVWVDIIIGTGPTPTATNHH